MTTSVFNISTYSRFNLSDIDSDIHIFVSEFRERIKKQLAVEADGLKSNFISFAEKKLSLADLNWLEDNERRFFKHTPNERIQNLDYLSEMGFIFCMVYSPDGDHIIVGYSTGMIERAKTTGLSAAEFAILRLTSQPSDKSYPNSVRVNIPEL